MNVVLIHKGIIYTPEVDYEEDNRKIFHECSEQTGFNGVYKYYSIPLSPYTEMTWEIFKNWIDMGKPTREQLGGINERHHKEYYKKWITEQLENELGLHNE